jgi:hypothetical protein
MTDLLIRDVDPRLKRQIEENARKNKRSLSDEAKETLARGIARSPEHRKLGTLLFESVRPEDRGDDLVFEVPGDISAPPDFE